MLIAGGAAYKAGTTPADGATNAGRKHAPMMRRVLLATPASERTVRAEHQAKPAQRAVAVRHESTTIVIVRAHRRKAAHRLAHERATGITKRHSSAPVATRPVTQPQAPRHDRLQSPDRNLIPLPQVTVPPVQLPPVQLPPVQVPTVSVPQLPPVTVPTPPPVPQLPDPPPLPKIP
jgi:hypothetical protein